MNGQYAVFAFKTGDDEIDQQRRCEDAKQDESRADNRENAKDRGCNMLSLFIFFSRPQLRINSDERRR
jgi:hypothetical protein